MEINSGKRIGRPPRNEENFGAVREAIAEGCSLYETVRRTGVSMYIVNKLKRELRSSGVTASAAAGKQWQG